MPMPIKCRFSLHNIGDPADEMLHGQFWPVFGSGESREQNKISVAPRVMCKGTQQLRRECYQELD
jgi:hypothetical protein